MDQPSPMQTPMPWNLVADAYTEEIVPMFELYARDALAQAKLPAGARVVDVACGPGTLAILAAQAGAKVDAVDFSAAMIDHCKARLAQLGITGVTPQVGDGQALPFDAHTFDAAFVMFGMMFFPDRAKGLVELRRVLVPGGRAVIATWTPLEDTALLAAMFEAISTTATQILGSAPPQRELPLTTEAACRAEVTAAGFRDVTVRRVSFTQTFPSANELWGSIERTMAPIVLMKRALGDKWSQIGEAARLAINGVNGAGAGELNMTALVTSGTA